MGRSIRDIPKRKGRPKTTGQGTGILVRMHDDQLAALDRWISAQFTRYSRPEAIRLLIDLGLAYREALPVEKRKPQPKRTR